MRKLITIALGFALIIASYFVVQAMIKSNQRPERKAKKIVKTVFVDIVKNTDIPITIKVNGNLVAKNRIEIFSEVQGVLHTTSKEFKAGVAYKKGEVILKINKEEEYATLQSQKSNLYNTITSIMPDVRLDFPDEYEKWRNYLTGFDFNKPIPNLPEINSEKEKFFVSSRNIYTTYYNVKNLEVRLRKYTIRAPYNGILTDALVNPGSLVRQGQKLGEFINPNVYEMEIAISASYSDLLKKGSPVKLKSLDNSQSWEGKIIRVNGRVDQASQTVKTFIQVSGKGLKEGMYLEAHLIAKQEENAYEIARQLLVNNEKVFVLQDSVLALVDVTPVYFKDKTVVVKGLKEGTIILSKPVPGAYFGMAVKVYNSTPTTK
ncbi:MAG: HlyD family efflux transporter periplasmic adaptor subunit [Cyclobacteriaceae bacterium]|nr:HlyD family efflux transporter periplasmic adaptor subunit [Cyclobacteriaceae bacterium]